MGPNAGTDGHGKISHPPGFDPRTVRPAASSYTVYAALAVIIESKTEQLSYKVWKFLLVYSLWLGYGLKYRIMAVRITKATQFFVFFPVRSQRPSIVQRFYW